MSYMANLKRDKFVKNHLNYLNLAFHQAEINLGSTNTNPAVGCIIEKNGSVISSGYTSCNGRPHAESNALKKKINFKGANIYSTLEPCSHYGKTPPCVNKIIKKGIKNVFFSIYDIDNRSKKKSKKKFRLHRIKTHSNLLEKKGRNFYRSYFNLHKNKLPLIDCKIAISKDYFTISKNSKWISNKYSRKITHLLRSRYNCIVSTSESINKDNSLLNCRIPGLEHKTPDLIIIDRNLKIRKNLKIFKNKVKRKIIIFTNSQNQNKIKWLKQQYKLKVILLKEMKSKDDFVLVFKYLIKMSYTRVLIESGLKFTNFLIKNKFLDNIYIFKTNIKLKKKGFNNEKVNLIKNIKLKNKLDVFLFNDELYKEKLNNV